nr:MAG TPA: hypothetical protein [Caudoviricetes sp.]
MQYRSQLKTSLIFIRLEMPSELRSSIRLPEGLIIDTALSQNDHIIGCDRDD